MDKVRSRWALGRSVLPWGERTIFSKVRIASLDYLFCYAFSTCPISKFDAAVSGRHGDNILGDCLIGCFAML